MASSPEVYVRIRNASGRLSVLRFILDDMSWSKNKPRFENELGLVTSPTSRGTTKNTTKNYGPRGRRLCLKDPSKIGQFLLDLAHHRNAELVSYQVVV
jgi:hypothetical protein